jgi:hypothetical protein
LLYWKKISGRSLANDGLNITEQTGIDDEDDEDDDDGDEDGGDAGDVGNAVSSPEEANPILAAGNVTPPEMAHPEKVSLYELLTADLYSRADKYIRTDSMASLKPREAFRRFQRSAFIYWATHCQAAKSIRYDDARPLKKLFQDFLYEDGAGPAFQH